MLCSDGSPCWSKVLRKVSSITALEDHQLRLITQSSTRPDPSAPSPNCICSLLRLTFHISRPIVTPDVTVMV
ncbi:hypothetical protein NSPZN2_40155 [Nitrospira defluvii]|uniref:Uncharacterized protein n=1 Tax=Nitrospira defluvii TaxID=330214 RepID=A0ABM8RRU0_9BACT|nr:hypothetical protein NSPZN2_40155 [Nitrospira defluvii]